MRASFVHLLVAVLIAVFAIGAPQAALADCARCAECTVEAPAKNDTPCPQKGQVCQMAQSCSGQVQKMPAPSAIHPAQLAGKATFGQGSIAAVKLTHITPETAPPRP
jgi:hypothetical protein